MENIDLNSELTVDKIAEIAIPEETAKLQAFQDTEMPVNASDYKPLIDFFGIQSVDRKTQEQLQNVWEHYSKNANSPATVIKRIKTQLYGLAQPQLGDTRLNQLNNYVKILRQLDDAKDMKDAFEA